MRLREDASRMMRRGHLAVALALLAALMVPVAGCADAVRADDASNDAPQGMASAQEDTAVKATAPAAYAYTAWDEAESPNYARYVGEAQAVTTLEPGQVAYAELDELGRAGRVEAHITYQMMEDGRARERSSSLPDPAGWGQNAEVEIELPLKGRTYHGWFWNRSHLLAKSLGGDDERHNLVTGTRMQNVGANDGQGGMDLIETACRSWLEDYPEVTISYVATPVYEGEELLPRSVFVDVLSSDGAIDEQVEVYNAAKGYIIDYRSGAFSAL